MNIDYTNSYNIRDIIRAFANRERYQEIASRTGDLSFINICLDLDEILELAKLTDMEHALLDLRYCEGLTLKEIGDKFGFSHQTAKNHIYVALNKIQKILNEWSDNGEWK